MICQLPCLLGHFLLIQIHFMSGHFWSTHSRKLILGVFHVNMAAILMADKFIINEHYFPSQCQCQGGWKWDAVFILCCWSEYTKAANHYALNVIITPEWTVLLSLRWNHYEKRELIFMPVGLKVCLNHLSVCLWLCHSQSSFTFCTS